VLLDEPFSGLDVGSALVIRSLIQQLAPAAIVADDSIERLRTMMSLPTLEEIFHFLYPQLPRYRLPNRTTY